MKILLTGATGYIGQRLLPALLQQGHDVYCCVRDASRLDTKKYEAGKLKVIEIDLTDRSSLDKIPEDIDVAYYLVHSMNSGTGFRDLELNAALHFVDRINNTSAKQIIYLSGIVNADNLSEHLASRKDVEDVLASAEAPLTTLRAGIIVGSGSASFEIIRDLVEKLPVMIAPKWLQTKTQPIAIRNVIEYLSGVLLKKETYHKHYDLYGPDTLTYKDMLMMFAKERGLKRHIYTVPVMTPRLSSYWLYFVTSTSYPLARNLVESMKVEVVAEKNDLSDMLCIRPLSYREAIRIAFDKIEQNIVLSTWKDALTSTILSKGVSNHIKVPEYGCFQDKQQMKTTDPETALNRIFAIGGNAGWYYADWLWGFRGFLDKMFGGVGLRRGRKNKAEVQAGETLDFWRVLYANRADKRLLLYAEMKLPGEAWLEFKITKDNILHQTATFRPLGIFGRLYWYMMLPFHYFIFKGMISKITRTDPTKNF
jgi:uncharacterized protein YbjT (DUF2867 family)